jgi:deoxyribose-phosphate aldolase
MTEPFDPQRIIAALEHTKLHFAEGETPEQAIRQLCQEAIHYGMATVCVRPEYVSLARECLGHSHSTALAAVVGFPERPITPKDQAEYPIIGACNSTTKLQEITTIQMYGGEEFDAVMNVRFMQTDKEIDGHFTRDELQALRMVAGDMPIKLILEVDLLSEDELRYAIQCAVNAGMDMIKTSTGYIKGGTGATPERIRFMRRTLDELGAAHIGIKASGGVRTLTDAKAVLEAGACRIGTSNAVAIAEEARKEAQGGVAHMPDAAAATASAGGALPSVSSTSY